MKKIIALFASLTLLAAAITACSDNKDDSPELTTTATQPEGSGDQDKDDGQDGNGGSEADEGAAQKILDAIKQAYGDDYIPDTPIPEELLSGSYGLDPESYTEVAAEMPMISANVDTVIIVKAASGKSGDVKAALTAYHDKLVTESLQYPQNVAKVNAAQVVADGDYVAFIMLGAYDERENASDSERAEFAEEQVQIGVDAFNAYFD